jgi:hypothetical protein
MSGCLPPGQVRRAAWSRPLGCLGIDFADAADSDDRVTEDAQGADADVLSVGGEPAEDPGRGGSRLRLLIIAETAALIALIVVALHYRAEAGQLHHRRPSTTSPPSVTVPEVTSRMFRLPAEATITGTVLITAAAEPGADRAQFVLSAVITGARPDTVYVLTGNDCSAVAQLPDHAWATGLTDANGTAVLTGHPWTGAVADHYWLALNPSPVSPPPGLHGTFAQGAATPFPAHQAPCAPSP